MMFLLAFTQLFLLLFCFGLARELFALKRLQTPNDNWPFEMLGPGDNVPAAVMKFLTRETLSLEGTVLLCAVTSDDLDQMFASLTFVCGLWRRKPILLCESGHLASRCSSSIGHSQAVQVVPHLGREMGLSSNTIMFVQDARIVEASAQAKTPSEIRVRFAFLSEP
jgi:hypothetical protein